MNDSFNTGVPYFDQLQGWDGKREYKLDVPRRLLEKLSNPQDSIKTIHVAGTNGKGSVSALIAGAIHLSGRTPVGFLCSPHLSSICERLLINSKPVSFEILNEASLEIEKVARSLDLNPSFFEAVVATSFLIAQQQKLEYLVVETGLGGRLDATNLITSPELSVITNIDYDHTHILGETLEEIAREKAGIIKADRPVFLGKMPEVAEEEIRKIAEEKNSKVYSFGEDFSLEKDDVRIFDKQFSFSALSKEVFNKESINNRLLAGAVVDKLGLYDSLEGAYEKVFWPGRFEIVRNQNQLTILDVAHNPSGAASLVAALSRYIEQSYLESVKPVFLISMLKRKNWKKMLELFLESFDDSIYILTKSSHSEALEPTEMKDYIREINTKQESKDREVQVEACPNKALELASSKGKVLVICGSIFLVGELRSTVVKEKFSILRSCP